MKMKELKDKTQESLEKLLQEKREKLRQLRFELSQDKLKNVSEIKNIKKNIARILTIITLKSKSQKPKS